MKRIIYILSLLIVRVSAGQNVDFNKENFKDNKDGLRDAKKNIDVIQQYFNTIEDSLYTL